MFLPLCYLKSIYLKHIMGAMTSKKHQPYDCLLNRLFRRRSKKTSKLCVTGLCEVNSTVTSEFPAQRASSAENLSIWWHHVEKYLNTYSWYMLRLVFMDVQDGDIYHSEGGSYMGNSKVEGTSFIFMISRTLRTLYNVRPVMICCLAYGTLN